MDRLLRMMMQSKAFQKFGVGAAMIFLVMFLLHQYKIVPFKVSMPIVVGLILVILAYQVFLKGAAKKKSSSFEKGLEQDVSAGKEGGKVSTRKAQAEIVDRWKNALGELKKAGMDLYTLPWYMLIGEPQSGKSTTLKNSGLEFPVGTEALSGAGGTRNCDWWFTNEGVILDTAGRFSFQEKNAPDAAQWTTFLRLLKKKRSACPINGVIIVIPCSSLLGDSDEERERKAMNLREKMNQLQREFEVQFPVFILLTKSDQMLGFTEFFSGLPAKEQHQILGWSMPGPFIQAFDATKFNETFDEISARIHKLRLQLVGEDRGLSEIDKLYVFPDEFRAIREPLHDYLKTIFMKTHYLPSLFFRGFYFTSGLQQGKPIAKALSALLRSAGEGADELVEDLAKVFNKSKAFFIRDFYKDKLFAEKNMVVHSEKKLGVSRKLGLAAIAASVLLIVLTAGFMVWQGLRIRNDITTMEALAEGVKNEFIASRDELVGPVASDQLDDTFALAVGSVKTARDFRTKSVEFEERISLPGLHEALRDMYWMYFAQCVLYQQSRLLSARMGGFDAGASLEGEAESDLYSRYVGLHSLSRDWTALTSRQRSRKTSFDEVSSLGWTEIVTSGSDLTGIFKTLKDDAAEEIRITDLESLNRAFALELEEGFALSLGEELDFGDEIEWAQSGRKQIPDPENLKANPPLDLPLSAGEIAVADNELLKREMDFIYDRELPPDQADVDRIVARAQALDAVFGQQSAGLAAVDCGFEDPAQSEPYAPPLNSAAQIIEAFNQLQDQLSELATKGGSLGAYQKDEADFRKEFDRLKWREAASGETEDQIDDYVDERIEALLAKFDAAKKRTLASLQGIERWVTEQGTLTEGAAEALKAVQALEGLMSEHTRTMRAIVDNPPTGVRQVETFREQWSENQAHHEAEAWAADMAQRLDLEGQDDLGVWKDDLRRLSATVDGAIMASDESVWIEANVQYVLYADPGVPLTQTLIAAASLSAELPPGAGFDWLNDKEKAIASLRDRLDGLGVGPDEMCDTNKARLDAGRGELSTTREANRANFVEFWTRAWNRWDPNSWVSEADLWGEFRTLKLIEQPQNLNKRINDELGQFLYNLEKYRQLDEASLGRRLERDYRTLEDYLRPGSPLFESLRDYTDTIGQLSDNPLTAYTQLDEQKRSKLASIDKIPGLEGKFTAYARQVPQVEEEAETLFTQKLGEFLRHWRDTGLPGKFPFEPESAQAQVTVDELKDYFFDEVWGLDAFLRKYERIFNSWSDTAGNEPMKTFVDRSRSLKTFFLDGDRYREIALSASFVGSPQRTDEAYPFVSRLRLPGSADQGFDPRGTTTTKDYKWTPSDYASDETLGFKAELPQNRDSINYWNGEFKLDGDFAPLAYIYFEMTRRNGEPTQDRTTWQQIPFRLTPEGNTRVSRRFRDEPFAFNFDFKLDRGMPELPDWNAIARWVR